MSNLKSTNGFLLVEKYDKVRRNKGDSPFQLDTNDNLGIVRQCSPNDIVSVGTKVYFITKDSERLVVEGVEMYAMKIENIVAVLEEQPDDKQ